MLAPWRGGLGDAIQGARIIPYIAPHCPDATLAVRRPLVRLFGSLGLAVVAWRDVDPADYPGGIGTNECAFLPAGVRLPHFEHMALPTLWVDEDVRFLPDPARLHVGLCWHGSGGGRSAIGLDDDPRCVPPALLRPLLELAGVQWVGLQLADHARELPIPGLDSLGVRDFADTAGLLRQLDVVVTIDTSVAHLCGVLGVPTWLLLVSSQHPTFDGGRWNQTPPLYPTVRQFRQSMPGDWAGLMDQVAVELAAVVNTSPESIPIPTAEAVLV